MANALVSEGDWEGGTLGMQRIDGGGPTNRSRKSEFFRPREGPLRIPDTILKNLGLFRKFIENSTDRVGSDQWSIRGRRVSTSELNFHALDAVELICSHPRQQVCDTRRASY